MITPAARPLTDDERREAQMTDLLQRMRGWAAELDDAEKASHRSDESRSFYLGLCNSVMRSVANKIRCEAKILGDRMEREASCPE